MFTKNKENWKGKLSFEMTNDVIKLKILIHIKIHTQSMVPDKRG